MWKCLYQYTFLLSEIETHNWENAPLYADTFKQKQSCYRMKALSLILIFTLSRTKPTDLQAATNNLLYVSF